MVVDDLLAPAAEQFLDDELVGAGGIIVQLHQDDAAPFGEGDLSGKHIATASHPNGALRGLRIDL